MVATIVTQGFLARPALATPFLTGSVFNDVGYDGSFDPLLDAPLSGVTVTVTDASGATATAATIADGSYSVDLAALTGTDYRVEVDPSDPSFTTPVELVAAPGSDFVRFSDGAPVDFVLRAPGLSPCQAELYVSCFNTGLHDGPSNVGEPAVISVPWSTTATDGPRYVKGSAIADIPEVGAVWGLGVQDRTGDVFTSAALRRHNDLGPDGLGAIYKNNTAWADLDGAEDGTFGTVTREILAEDPGTPELESYMNLEGAPSTPSGAAGDPSHDFDAYGKVGMVGIGGLDVGPDDDELFFVNLASRELWSIGVNADGTADLVSAGSVGGEPWLSQSCVNGEARAWAVKTWQAQVHVGVVCTGELGGVQADLTAHMYAFDPAAGTWSGDLLAAMSLAYPKDCSFTFAGTWGCGGWLPWHSDALTISGPVAFAGRQIPDGPTPILSDFAFDPLDGSVVLSFLDRSGLQMAHDYLPYSTTLTFYVAGGDIVKAAWNGSGYTPNTAAPEFYDDEFQGGSDRYTDSTWGSVATFVSDVPGERHVMTPGPKAEAPLEGLHVFDQDTGLELTTHEIGVLPSPFGSGNNGKSLALGEIDGAECGDIAIGNRVWLDSDGDGIQGAGELGIAGVTVAVYTDPDGVPNSGDEVFVASKATDVSGNYEFYSTDGLEPHSDYMLVIAAGDAPGGMAITTADALANADDHGDSDGSLASGGVFDGAIVAAAASGAPGENDFSYDFGFVPAVSIGSFVWDDLDADGLQDAGEPGIDGATVELLVDDGSGTFVPAVDVLGASVAAIVTGADGLYRFDGLPEGDYRVRVTPGLGYGPSPAQTTTDNDPTEDDSNIASEPVASTYESATFSLQLGAEATESGTQPGDDQDDSGDGDGDMTVDFGFHQVAAIGDTVWEDLNANGVQDAGELGIEAVTVNLLDASGNVLDTTTTNASGFYQFTDLTPGDYAVHVVAPAGYEVSPVDQGGDDTTDSDIDAATGESTPTTLISGEVDPTWDAGLYRLASIGDTVWEDLDADGVQSPGEPGIGAVTVNLLDGGGNVVDTTSTSPTGFYEFVDLTPGDYAIQVVVPAGYIVSPIDQGTDDTDDSDLDPTTLQTAVTSLSSGEDDPTWDAGLYQLASIGDTVWEDLNANGVQDAGEPGIDAVTVNLLDASGNVLDTTTTNASGFYQFTDLTPGDYAVEVVAPAGYSITPLDQGTDDTVDSDVDESTGRTAVTTLTSGEDDPTWDAGLHQPASIGDTVWDDQNTDGIQDAGELGIGAVTVNLLDAGGNVLDTTTTDANGFYEFVDLTPGDYAIQVVVPAGYVVSPIDQGTDDTADSDLDPITLQTPVTSLSSGEDDPTWDAGLYETTSLGDFVWHDLDANGVQDAGELGIEAVTVNLLDASGNVLDTTTTDANGFYRFDDLLPGSYQVQLVVPEGYALSPNDEGADDSADSDVDPETAVTPVVALGAGDVDVTLDAGLYQPASLGDYVWFDVDEDGVQDDDENPAAGITVELIVDGLVVDTTTTDADGRYLFEDLIPGTYTVRFTAPAEHVLTGQALGGDGGTDSDADPSTGESPAVALAQGEDRRDVDAGLVGTELDLAIVIELTNDPSTVGDDAVYRIDVENTGNTMVDGGVEVELQLSAGLDFMTATGTDWIVSSVSADGRTVVLTNPSPVLPGDTLPPIELRADTTMGGSPLRVDATVATASGAGETTSANNVSAAQVSVATAPTLAFTGIELKRSLLVALALIAIGLALVGFSRRRLASVMAVPHRMRGRRING
jgi:uncharacterized repeat protein (TIGR01451 family)